ncbi:MAG: phosphatidate cytidylyltransferase [Chloroflexi bacterium]|nr:phosphatidate cytidylyltransferase [Chloroflexota bacterium]
MLKQRLITAAWGIPLIIAVVWVGQPWFAIITAIWGLLAAREFYSIVAAARVPPLAYFGMVWTVLLIFSPLYPGSFAQPLLLTAMVMLPLIWLILRPNREEAFTRWAWTIAGILYVGWLLSYMVALRSMDGNFQWSKWVLTVLLITFASDTSAFFIGRKWGKRRLAPSISPKKTCEGAVAGVVGAIVASFILWRLLPLSINPAQVTLLGFLISVFGQLGDLVESLFKRNMGVKDSGNTIPGHGGVLDRMDSVVFAGVVVYYIATIVGR